MKRQIILDVPIVPPFDRGGRLRTTARETHRVRAALKCRLDRPPDGTTILHALNTSSAFVLAENPVKLHQRILVVEDDADLRQIYLKALIRSGYQVDAAEDGEAGWRMLDGTRSVYDGYDLLITDSEMPQLSGVELIQKLRSAGAQLPVILASGAMPTNADRLHLAAILPKPFSQSQLIQTVREVLRAVQDEQTET